MSNSVYKETLFSLGNKVAVVVGGGGQIGSRTCDILLEAGARVAILDFAGDYLNALVEEKKTLYPEKIKGIGCNIIEKSNIIQAKNEILSRWETVDILINHAHFKGDPRKLKPGASFFAPFEEYDVSIWQDVLSVNLTGMFLCCQIFGKIMADKGSGCVVNTSSTYGIVSPNQNIYEDSGINSPVSYATTKAAIINFSRYLATYWGKKGVRVNVLSPGGVENKGQSQKFRENYCDKTPMGRMAKADEYQGAILFLCSDASSYMTGANLVVDGGWTAW